MKAIILLCEECKIVNKMSSFNHKKYTAGATDTS